MSIVHLETGGGGDRGDGDDAELVAALRLRAAEALEGAYGFLAKQPDPWAQLRAQVLCGARPAADLTEKIAAIQNADGSLPIGTLASGGAIGFPPIRPEDLDSGASAIVGTLEGLLIAADAKIMYAEWVEPAVRALESCQAEDGAFRLATREGRDASDVSDTSDASDAIESADIFWTGMVAGILGRTPLARPDHLDAAGEFLTSRFTPESVEDGGYSLLMANAHFFTNVHHDSSDEMLQWCGRALEKGFRSRRFDAVATIRVLLTCDARALPGATFDVSELLEGLLEEQAGDGGFAELSIDGAAMRTTPTFDAMLGIVRLCAALGD